MNLTQGLCDRPHSWPADPDRVHTSESAMTLFEYTKGINNGTSATPVNRKKTVNKLKFVLTAIAMTGLCFAPIAFASHEGGAKGEKIDVIIGYKARLDRSQSDNVRRNGGKIKREFGKLRMRSASLPPRAIERLKRSRRVAFVVPDERIESFSASARATANVPYQATWNTLTTRTQLESQKKMASTKQVGVAVIDSGVGRHGDLYVAQRIDCYNGAVPGLSTSPCVTDVDDGATGVYLDNFDVTAFNNSDGSIKWGLTPWVEFGDNNSPSGGSVSVEIDNCPDPASRCIEFDGRGGVGDAVQRPVDLSKANSAILTFDYRIYSVRDHVSYTLDVSTDGGNNWSSLATYSAQNGDNLLVFGETIDLSAYRSADAVIRFRVHEYDPDAHMYIDNVAIQVIADDAYDPFGHGTHVAGVIGASGASSNGAYQGIAPYTPIHSLRVFDENGVGNVSDAIAALDWILANGAKHGIGVVNLSLGKALEESNTTDPLVLAVEAVWDAGFVVVASAGNYGRDGNFTITSPGNSRKIITVGSLTDAGTADYSDGS